MLLEAVVALVTVFSLAVAAISAVSYRRSGSRKVLLVSVAFAIIFAKGLILSAGLLREDVEWETLLLVSTLMDAATVALLFVALVLRRGRGPATD
jgi:hypothetical protein